MGRARKYELDVFVQFLLDEGGFGSVTEAADALLFDQNSLNRANARKIRSLPAMARWSAIFNIPRVVFGLWISDNIDALVADTELIDLAS